MKVAFIGLGVMGYPMAGHVKAAGNDMCVYNRTAENAKAWVAEFGGTSAASPDLAAKGRDLVLVCVGNDDDVREVVLGDNGAAKAMEQGSILVDHTTASAALARELDSILGSRGIGFMDGPVSGGQAGAVNGALTVMLGGNDADYEKAKPVMDSYSRFSKVFGTCG